MPRISSAPPTGFLPHTQGFPDENVGPDFGEGDNPSRDVFKTKAAVVKFVQAAVADRAQVIQQQGDAGLDPTTRFFGKRMAHNSYIWMFAIEHSGQHYGQTCGLLPGEQPGATGLETLTVNRSTTDRRNNGNHRFRAQPCGESTAVPNIFIPDEEVDVRPNFALFGDNPIAHPGTQGPECQ